MTDKQFVDFRNALDTLKGHGVFTVTIPAEREAHIINAIVSRFGELPRSERPQLCGVYLVFI